ncbi:hypothetical protein D3C76_1074860 [compost metagenome]
MAEYCGDQAAVAVRQTIADTSQGGEHYPLPASAQVREAEQAAGEEQGQVLILE